MRTLFRTAAGACAALVMAASQAVLAGPIFLTGHDPDFHAQDSSGAQNLLASGLNFVTGGTYASAGNKFLWVESRIPTPGGHRVGEAGLGTLGLSLGTHYDRSNAAELAGLNFSDYTAVVVASSFGGLLTRAELDALIARKSDLTGFVNDGGGLMALAECYPCGADLLAGATDPLLFGFVPVDVTSIGANPPFTVTAAGASAPFNLTNADLNDPTHNSFGLVGGLQVLDTDSAGNAVTLAGVVRITDGGFESVPEPGTLALLALASLCAAGAARRAR